MRIWSLTLGSKSSDGATCRFRCCVYHTVPVYVLLFAQSWKYRDTTIFLGAQIHNEDTFTISSHSTREVSQGLPLTNSTEKSTGLSQCFILHMFSTRWGCVTQGITERGEEGGRRAEEGEVMRALIDADSALAQTLTLLFLSERRSEYRENRESPADTHTHRHTHLPNLPLSPPWPTCRTYDSERVILIAEHEVRLFYSEHVLTSQQTRQESVTLHSYWLICTSSVVLWSHVDLRI